MSVRIVEVGPRDGLQNVQANIPTSTKIELIKRLQSAGLQIIELTSLVSPKAIPQLADSLKILKDEEIRSMVAQNKLQCPVLVPNMKGLETALQLGVREVAVFVSATEDFSMANIKCNVEEGLARARKVATRAHDSNIKVRGYFPL